MDTDDAPRTQGDHNSSPLALSAQVSYKKQSRGEMKSNP